ncbi:MAG: membrane protein insertase YidC [Candidatus Azosocius agrarius]|nr:MAG: membrane protein insertase YidC [Gammaproteobacteria bacterium]
MFIQNIRFILLGLLFGILFLLFNYWQSDHIDQPLNINNENNVNMSFDNNYISSLNIDKNDLIDSYHTKSMQRDINDINIISVKTDLYNIKIDTYGGDIIFLELIKYPISGFKNTSGFILFDTSDLRYYVAQCGLLSEYGPDSIKFGKIKFSCEKNFFEMTEEKLYINLTYETVDNIKFIKRFCFKRDNYLIDVEYIVHNESSNCYYGYMYGRLKQTERIFHDNFLMMSARSYIGGAVYTPNKHYKKISFSDMKSSKNFEQQIFGGWIAMVEHYFLGAWIPSQNAEHIYCSEKYDENTYGLRFIDVNPLIVEPGHINSIKSSLFAGPEIVESLKNISDGLSLTVDYGILWPIAQPIFWLLKTSYTFSKNWGFAIIITTLFIKILFYQLSASSYKSIGKMRHLQPRINLLKESCGEDKTKFGKAVMDLYKQENVNPLGGCLPIIVQIPVFISLYYVLLESIELRQASFIFWIKDLSLNDPYYVLPVIMGISMFVQQKLSPAPLDPMQAKMMMIMPLIFSFLCFQFPSGLVLYWVVNNLLSIIQQIFIVRKYS